jgi:phage terminase large subunit-like protein
LLDTATRHGRGLILYPAAHGKTTLVSTLLPIWAICCDPNIRIAIIAKNDYEATNIMSAILEQLSANDRLVEDFGPFKPDDDKRPWSLTKLTVAKRSKTMKEPTIAIFGAGAKTALGHRTDWTICDDVVTNENSATPEQRGKMRTWFMQSVRTMPRLPTSRVTVVGTLFHPEDLYHELVELTNPETGLPIWKLQREDAIVDEEAHTTLWPSRWPWRLLMELKAEFGTLDFNKRFRNIAVDPSRMAFREEYIKGGWIGKTQYPGCIDKEHCVGDYDDSWKLIAGFDPAVGATRSAKFCAHIVLAEGACAKHEKCIWVIDLIRDQLTLPQQVDTILEQHENYDCFSSKIEAVSYQAGLVQAVQQKMEERGTLYRIEPHYTNRQNKLDPEIGIPAMSPWFENGQVHIPWGNPESQRKMKVFVDELVQYPGRTTDTVLACWFAWLALKESAPRYTSHNRLKRHMIVPNRRPGRRVLNPYYAKD